MSDFGNGKSGPIRGLTARDDRTGREVRAVSLVAYWTTVTSLLGAFAAVLAFVLGAQAERRALLEELRREYRAEIAAEISAAKAVAEETHRGIRTEIGALDGRVDALEQWRFRHTEIGGR